MRTASWLILAHLPFYTLEYLFFSPSAIGVYPATALISFKHFSQADQEARFVNLNSSGAWTLTGGIIPIHCW